MKTILERINNEPVVLYTVIQSFITVLVTFGIGLSTEQVGAILILTSSVLALVTRGQVTPNHIVAQKVDVALNTPVPENNKEQQ